MQATISESFIAKDLKKGHIQSAISESFIAKDAKKGHIQSAISESFIEKEEGEIQAVRRQWVRPPAALVRIVLGWKGKARQVENQERDNRANSMNISKRLFYIIVSGFVRVALLAECFLELLDGDASTLNRLKK